MSSDDIPKDKKEKTPEEKADEYWHGEYTKMRDGVKTYGSYRIRVSMKQFEDYKSIAEATGYKCTLKNPVHIFKMCNWNGSVDAMEAPTHVSIMADTPHVGKFISKDNNIVINDDGPGCPPGYSAMTKLEILDLQHDNDQVCPHCASVQMIFTPRF